MFRGLILASSSLVALALPQMAMAQQVAGDTQAGDTQDSTQDSSGYGDIIVTATRQPTNLQDTPIAITAITSEDLQERGITNIADLTSVVPNAQFRRVQGAFGPGVSAFIRGLGSGDTGLAGEPAVAFYIDDVYYPVLLGANFDLLDISHIEVLRGPQGTLFGRNSLAGGINIVARQPRIGEASGYVEGTVGSFDRREIRAGFNVPLGENVALMVSGTSKQRTGYQRQLDFTCEMNRRGTPELAGSFPVVGPLQGNSANRPQGDCVIGHYGGEDIQALRGSLRWEATPDVALTLTGDYIRDRSENAADTVVDIDPNRASANMRSQAAYFGLTIDSRFLTGDPYASYATYTDRIPAGTLIRGNTYYNGTATRGGYSIPNRNDLVNWGVAGKLEWDLGGVDLTAIVAHREIDEIHTFDTDGLPLVVEHVINDIVNTYTHAELRLGGQSELIDWVGGLFYFKANGVQNASLIQASTGGQRTIFTTYEPLSKAVFANATVRPFGERLGIVLGARYADDRKEVNFSNVADFSATNPATDIRFQVIPADTRFSWKAGLNFQASDEALLYASASTGYSLPTYNPRPLQKTQVAQVEGNENIAYEVGAKLDLFDRMVRINLAAFYTDFSNRPTTLGGAEAVLGLDDRPVSGNQQLIPLPGGPEGATRCSTEPVPAGTGITCIGRTYYINTPATVRGFEVEYQINPLDGLLINGSVGWSKFTSPDIAARAVNRRQSNPFWTANAGIQYEMQSDEIGGSITPRLDWTYESSQVVSATSTKYNDLMPARSLFNARVSYLNDEYDFSVALGVTNMFDKFYYRNVFDYQGLGYPQTDAQPAPPREWSLSVSKRF